MNEWLGVTVGWVGVYCMVGKGSSWGEKWWCAEADWDGRGFSDVQERLLGKLERKRLNLNYRGMAMLRDGMVGYRDEVDMTGRVGHEFSLATQDPNRHVDLSQGA
ncbi:hypothetical protein Pmani_025802 [Petrolisthes manimaculis]|uniref:Uncharacterized protein n=1 Tax=Petrolisthes manimaculis TaxID=1843537 RepID=A0AAE1P4S9_9EUCA|nr:hypothetical protein Pmani_025802 [Petrolisthes manimaculis]